ncbi:metallophosphoesterase [Enterococcus sp. LJL128]
MKKMIIGFFALTITGIALAFYAFFIEPKMLTVDRHTLGSSNSQTAVKLLQISDIHLQKSYPTDQLKKIVEKVNEQEPDIVVFTGDLFDNFAAYGPVDETIELLNSIQAPMGKFAVWGNHDYGGGAASVYAAVMANSGFQLLENEGVRLPVEGNSSLYLAGIDDSLFGAPSMEAAFNGQTSDDYTILLSHEPDVTEPAAAYGASLVLSGHSHGGQVRIPFLPVNTRLAEKYISGFYSLGENTKLYVNTGLGTTAIPVRFRVPPQISFFQLYI